MNARTSAVVRAWTAPGPRPDVHRHAQDRLRREWPVLARALDALATGWESGKASQAGTGGAE